MTTTFFKSNTLNRPTMYRLVTERVKRVSPELNIKDISLAFNKAWRHNATEDELFSRTLDMLPKSTFQLMREYRNR